MLVLAVEDDGRGFDPQAPGTGAGLANLRSRVAALEGRIAWTAGPEGVGTRVNVRLPLAGAGQAADGLSPRRAPAP
jgi:signal transduction histidine kinase